ncbi:glycosyltransferase [Glaciecola punicea ACAM 611]|uniref:Glycosyltransferase n=1 Tax=Glaciecola punicea ACAM 611 TaxID=1121923 RepID=H5TA04_9ALTE|nr:glycosyltransferase family A protein [Glaciecola punicea]GAB55131.1 glycosyltransferase [Glaciecola punicea ACAM 611]
MKITKTYPVSKYNRFAIQVFRFITKPLLPRAWFRQALPPLNKRHAKTGHLTLEIVSHCWNYGNMLTYQLSSIVNNSPTKLSLTMTVFYAIEDAKTKATVDYFEQIKVANVTWNFQALSKGKLFRRGIGRNMVAQSTKADWLWFTDCDIIFHKNCLDSLAQALRGRQETLYYPRQERTTEMLSDSDPMLNPESEPQVVDIETENFSLYARDKAKGAFQIVHGDVARAIGYCDKLPMFQTESDRWRKTFEDTAFKWLVNSEGLPLEIDGVFQIRHVKKGRYQEGTTVSKARSKIRRMQE